MVSSRKGRIVVRLDMAEVGEKLSRKTNAVKDSVSGLDVRLEGIGGTHLSYVRSQGGFPITRGEKVDE